MAAQAKHTGVLSAAGYAVTLNVDGLAGIGIQLTGTWVGTLQFKGSVDGVEFQSLTVTPTSSTTGVTSATSNGIWQTSAALKLVQVLCSAYTSGYIVVSMVAGESSLPSGGGGGGGGGDATAANQVLEIAALNSIDAKTPALGQALAAASTPVVLTAAQISTLTPLATVAATQSGTWTVQPGNTPNTTPWLVTIGHGKTIKALSGSLTADTDIIAAVTSKRIKVIGYAFFTFGTSANLILLKTNGTGGTLLWTVTLQAQTAGTFGANMAVSAPSFIFATAAGEKLTADVNQSDTIYWSISYFDDDAS